MPTTTCRGTGLRRAAFAALPADLHHNYLRFAPVGEQVALRELCSAAAAAVEVRVRDEALEAIVARSLELPPDYVPAFAALRDFTLAPTAEELVGAVGGPPPGNLDHVLATVARHSPVLLWSHASPMAAVVAAWLRDAAADTEGVPCGWDLVPDPAAAAAAANVVHRHARAITAAAAAELCGSSNPLDLAERFLHDYGVVAVRRAHDDDGAGGLRRNAVPASARLTAALGRMYDNTVLRDDHAHLFRLPRPPGDAHAARDFLVATPGSALTSTALAEVDTLLVPCDALTAEGADGAIVAQLAVDDPVVRAKHMILPRGTQVAKRLPPPYYMFVASAAAAVSGSIDFTMCDPALRIVRGTFDRSGCTLLDLSPLHSLDRVGDHAFERNGIRRLLLPQHSTPPDRDQLVVPTEGCRMLFRGNSAEADFVLAPSPWLRHIPAHSFNGAQLAEIDLSGMWALDSIGDGAFMCCEKLQRVVAWPPRLARIGARAFEDADLQGLDFRGLAPSDERELVIEAGAFGGCRNMHDVVLPPTLVELGERVFGFGVKTIDFGACARLSKIGDAAIPASVAVIDLRATRVTRAPEHTLSEHYRAGAHNSTHPTPPQQQMLLPPTVTTVGGALSTMPIFAPGTRVVLKEGALSNVRETDIDLGAVKPLDEIPAFCFADHAGLSKLLLDATELRGIGDRAFANCKAFNPLPLVDAASATLESLGHACFIGSAAAGTFVVGPALKLLNTVAFENTAVTAVVAPLTNSALHGIQMGCFRECKALTSVNLSGCTALERIGDRCFENCSALATFIPPSSLASIGVAAFGGAVALTQVDFGGCTKLETIGSGAFVGCAALAEVRASDSTKLKDVQHGAFGQCAALTRMLVHAAVGPVLSGKGMITMIPSGALSWDGMPAAAAAAASMPRNAWAKPLATKPTAVPPAPSSS